MPYREAASWVCLTMFGAAVYFIFEWWGQDRLLAAVPVGAIGLVGLGYLVYQNQYPAAKLPSTGIWVWLPLVITWCFLGYAVHVSRIPAPVPVPADPPAQITSYSFGINKYTHLFFVNAIIAGSDTSSAYGKDNFMYIVCLKGDPAVDPGDDTAIDKSSAFDIADRTVEIQVRLGKDNSERLLKSGGNVDIYLVMIPKAVDVSTLSTFKEIYAHGGKLLGQTAIGRSLDVLQQELKLQ